MIPKPRPPAPRRFTDASRALAEEHAAGDPGLAKIHERVRNDLTAGIGAGRLMEILLTEAAEVFADIGCPGGHIDRFRLGIWLVELVDVTAADLQAGGRLGRFWGDD
jgi:hypothetical protein